MSSFEDRQEFDRPDDDEDEDEESVWERNGYSSESEYWNERI